MYKFSNSSFLYSQKLNIKFIVQNHGNIKYNNVQSAYENHGKIKIPDLIHKINSTKRNRRKSDDVQSSFTASRRSHTRSPLDTRAPGDPTPRNSTRHVSAVDRRSLRSPEPADSTDVLDDSGTHHAPPDTGRRAATTRPLRPYVEPRLTDC